jgi:hypothetical protein
MKERFIVSSALFFTVAVTGVTMLVSSVGSIVPIALTLVSILTGLSITLGIIDAVRYTIEAYLIEQS